MYSLISSGENLAFVHSAAAIAHHCNVALSFHQVPIATGRERRGRMNEKFA